MQKCDSVKLGGPSSIAFFIWLAPPKSGEVWPNGCDEQPIGGFPRSVGLSLTASPLSATLF